MSAKSRELSIGVIGAGRIGMLHAHNLARRVPHARVVAVADPRLACARAAATVAGADVALADYREILSRPDVDAVVVSSSTDTHARIIGEAAAAGKHIFCEKPIDHHVERIREALQAVARAGVRFQVGFNRRFDPDFQALAQRLRAGHAGVLQLLRITSRDPEPPPADYVRVSGGLFLDMSIHDLDMARFLMQEPVVEVFATGSAFDPGIAALGDVDTAVILLRFAHGALCTIDNSRRAVYGYDQRLEVFGSRACLTVPNRTPTRVEEWDAHGQHRERPQRFFLERYQESYVAEMQEFVDCVRQGREAAVSGQDGLQAVLLAQAARRSLLQDRPVHIDAEAGLDAA
ncbi:MAG TPA: inositol 2-dehydrogenase [Candidatus Krumholzibacteria bacterium]|nr:inositol 2-dehydrogenase [Candidatus Krumholzibacteria bacterium]